jgi:Sec-independent protein translocase protein TatA
MEKILLANRPKLSPGSLRTYVSILKNLEKQTALPLQTPDQIIEFHEEIMKHLADVPGNVRKTRLSALIVFIENAKGAEKVIKSFRDQMTTDNKQYKQQINKQEMTERQKEGYIPLSEVMEKYHALEKEVLPLMKKETLDAREFVRVQLYVLLSCLLLIEPRRSLDYTEFKIRKVDETKDNFMRMEKRKPFFIFNQYKTAGKHGQQSQDIPPKLHKIVKRWIELNPHDYLLMNTKQSNKISPTQLTQILHGFFDKPLSTSMIRHIYLTDKYKAMPALVEMQETAKAMGHTVEEALRYVKKVPSPKKA